MARFVFDWLEGRRRRSDTQHADGTLVTAKYVDMAHGDEQRTVCILDITNIQIEFAREARQALARKKFALGNIIQRKITGFMNKHFRTPPRNAAPI
jgi:hypothetical protein